MSTDIVKYFDTLDVNWFLYEFVFWSCIIIMRPF